MAKLTINFQFMFLFLAHKKGGIVLLPAKGHEATLTARTADDSAVQTRYLKGHQVDIVSSLGIRVFGQRSDPPRSRFLLNMDTVFDRPVDVIRSSIKDPVDPDSLNARFVLGGGRFIEHPTRDEAFRNVIWHVITPHGNRVSQPLTDSMSFEMNLGGAHEMVFKDRDGNRLAPIEMRGDTDVHMTVVNDDVGKSKLVQRAHIAEEKDYLLTEFHKLYDFLDVGSRPIGPMGRGPKYPFRGNGEPICGGGTGDPPEPQDDPPDP